MSEEACDLCRADLPDNGPWLYLKFKRVCHDCFMRRKK